MLAFSHRPVLVVALAAWLPAQGVLWQPVPASPVQPDVVHAAMASDPLRGRVVLFGANAVTRAPETWEWDGTVWHAIAATTQPPVRTRGAMAFDPARQRMLFTGGMPTITPGSGFQDAWEWDGVAWQQLPAVASRPVARAPGVTTDFAGGRVLSVDGYAVRAWDGATWQSLGNVPNRPQDVTSVSAVQDESRSRLLLQVTGFDTHFPPPLWVPTFVYRSLLFEWDGTFQPVPDYPGGVPWSAATAMFFDRERQRAAVVDQRDLTRPVSTLEWSGSWYSAGQQFLFWEPLFAYDHANATVLAYDAAFAPAQATRLFRLVSSTPATVQSAGTGCPGAIGVPALAASGYSRPWLGDVFAVDLDGVPAGSFPFVVVGLATAQAGLGGLGMPACQQLVTADAFAAMLAAPGNRATWSLALPPVSAVAGASVHLQGGVLAGGGAGPLGGALSQRLTATVGLR